MKVLVSSQSDACPTPAASTKRNARKCYVSCVFSYVSELMFYVSTSSISLFYANLHNFRRICRRNYKRNYKRPLTGIVKSGIILKAFERATTLSICLNKNRAKKKPGKGFSPLPGFSYFFMRSQIRITRSISSVRSRSPSFFPAITPAAIRRLTCFL